MAGCLNTSLREVFTRLNTSPAVVFTRVFEHLWNVNARPLPVAAVRLELPNVGIGNYCLLSVEIYLYCCLTLGKSIVVQVLFTHDPYSLLFKCCSLVG